MGRHYTFADLNTNEKPRITVSSRTFGDTTYPYACKGRAATGYGYTPLHAYRAWEKNWKRRHKFYGDQAVHAEQTIALHEKIKTATPRSKGPNYRCKHCGTDGLIWQQIEGGNWRLFATEPLQMHKCHGGKHG